MTTSICIFCGSRRGAGPAYMEAARQLGSLAGAAGLRVIYGGGHVGMMGGAADASMAAGGEVVGFIPARLLEREVGHRDITRLVVTGDMFERKRRMIADADAFVVLPGGLGTLDELLEVVTLRQLGYHDKPIVLVNMDGYWDPLLALVDRVIEREFAAQSARALYDVAGTVDEVLPLLGAIEPAAAPLRAAQAG
jgi:uncharacterized protein (TIGR00730 family)